MQHHRSLDAKAARLFKIAQVGAKEGTAAAQRVFIPAPVYMDLDDEEARTLEKFRKEQEAAKKKETGKSESAWKMGNAKKSVPYGYNYRKAGYSGGYGYGGGFGGAGGLGSSEAVGAADVTGLGEQAEGQQQQRGGRVQRPAGGQHGGEDGRQQVAVPMQRLWGTGPLEAR